MSEGKTPRPIRVMFVCLGNICRSPLAEGVFRQLVHEAGLSHRIEIDSSGTGRWHVGEPPDKRMRATAQRHGVSIDHQRGRQIEADDLEYFDYILAMDRRNYDTTRRLDDRDATLSKVHLFRSFDPTPDDLEVPDPYYGRGTEGFEEVYTIVDRTARRFLAHLIKKHGLQHEHAA